MTTQNGKLMTLKVAGEEEGFRGDFSVEEMNRKMGAWLKKRGLEHNFRRMDGAFVSRKKRGVV
jgi:hypothetical protein